MHGWGSHALAWTTIVPALVEAGLRPIALEAPGHGATVGEAPPSLADSGPESLSNMLLFVRALVRAGRALGPVHGVVGHSLGATAIPEALQQGLFADRAVMIAVTARTRDFLSRWAQRRELTPDQEAAVDDAWKHDFSAARLAEIEPLHLAPRFGQTPLLLLHDREDAEAPASDAEELHAIWPASRLEITDRLGHSRILLDRKVAAQIAAFLTPAR